MSVRDPAGLQRAHPRISVLTPVHNAGPFLVQTARSVLAQTFQDFEFILIDDGSTDGCTASVAALGDPRVAIISQGELKAHGKVSDLVAQYQCDLERLFLKLIGYQPQGAS